MWNFNSFAGSRKRRPVYGAKRKSGPSKQQLIKQKGRSQLLDPSKHGDVLSTPFLDGGQFAAPLIATRWLGQDFVITVPWYIERLTEWPKSRVALRRFEKRMRTGAFAISLFALHKHGPALEFGFDKRRVPWLPGMKQHLESVAVVRLVPEEGWPFFESDSLLAWFHNMRDGVYDTWAGFSLDKNNKVVAHGQYEDNDYKPDFVQIQYNQARADGHGVAFVFRFKAESLEQLKRVG